MRLRQLLFRVGLALTIGFILNAVVVVVLSLGSPVKQTGGNGPRRHTGVWAQHAAVFSKPGSQIFRSSMWRHDGRGAEKEFEPLVWREWLPSPDVYVNDKEALVQAQYGDKARVRSVHRFITRGWPFPCTWCRMSMYFGMFGAPSFPPMPSEYEGAHFIDRGPGSPLFGAWDERFVPFFPIWSGVVLNSITLGAVPLMLIGFVPYLRRALRTRRGRCPECGYQLDRIHVSTCPECGKRPRARQNSTTS